MASSSAISASRSAKRCAKEESDALVAEVTTSGERVGRKPWAAATKAAMGRPLSLLWSWSGALKVNWRIWPSALIRAPRAERLATTRTLMASTEPSLLLAVPWALPDCAARGLERVEGIGLAALSAGLTVLAVHFDDMDPRFGEETGDAGPIGPRPLHADLAHFAERFEPAEQCRIPVGIGPERLGAEQATDLVQDGGHVDLSVRVDATGDGARGFYDGHAIPSFP